MPPTIADVQASAKPAPPACRVRPDTLGSDPICDSTLSALDEILFEGRWFALSVDNRRVPGVVVASLKAGLELVGRGPVASIVGTLRAEVRVVDIDIAGQRGHQARSAVRQWCQQEGLWHVERASGGPDGHGHVFIVCPGRVEALEALVQGLREQLRVGRTRIEVRVAVRPLSAPHRTGAVIRPRGSLSAVLGQLRRHCWAQDAPTRAARRGGQVGTVLRPARRRARRDLPVAWQAYIDTGAAPTVAGGDQSRSTIEAIATGFLLRAGYDADTAWQVITSAHQDAFSKARSSQRRWVAWVWNRAVNDDIAFSAAVDVDGRLRLDVDAARARLGDLAWTLPTTARRSLLQVGYAVLDRVLRTGHRRVPVPERDLVLDTGLRDRKTIRAALRALHGHMGHLDSDAFDTHAKETTSFEFEIATTPTSAHYSVRQPR